MQSKDQVFRVNPDNTKAAVRISIDALPAAEAHMEGLLTWRAFPQQQLAYPDPFLLLNHHGPQKFKPGNNGLPFGPHPHRGFETLTFIISGELLHADSLGRQSVIGEGGVQWMTAGSGLVHAEISSEQFLRQGGNVEILQLWMNLPASLKMSKPGYQGFLGSEIPEIALDPHGSVMRLIAGGFENVSGPAKSITGLFVSELHLKDGADISLQFPAGRSLLLYTVSGTARINEMPLPQRHVAKEEASGSPEKEPLKEIRIQTAGTAILILAHGDRIAEPMASYGPFVMNTEAEIHEAISDFRSGKMGTLEI